MAMASTSSYLQSVMDAGVLSTISLTGAYPKEHDYERLPTSSSNNHSDPCSLAYQTSSPNLRSIMRRSYHSYKHHQRKCVSFNESVTVRPFEAEEESVLYKIHEPQRIHYNDYFGLLTAERSARRISKREHKQTIGRFRTCQNEAQHFAFDSDGSVMRQKPHTSLHAVLEKTSQRLTTIYDSAIDVCDRAGTEKSKYRIECAMNIILGTLNTFENDLDKTTKHSCARMRMMEALDELVLLFEKYVEVRGPDQERVSEDENNAEKFTLRLEEIEGVMMGHGRIDRQDMENKPIFV